MFKPVYAIFRSLSAIKLLSIGAYKGKVNVIRSYFHAINGSRL